MREGGVWEREMDGIDPTRTRAVSCRCPASSPPPAFGASLPPQPAQPGVLPATLTATTEPLTPLHKTTLRSALGFRTALAAAHRHGATHGPAPYSPCLQSHASNAGRRL